MVWPTVRAIAGRWGRGPRQSWIATLTSGPVVGRIAPAEMHLVATKGAPPRGEATSSLSRFSPHVFGDRGPEERAPESMPIGGLESTEAHRPCLHG